MEVIKAQMVKDEAAAPPIAPHAPAHGIQQPSSLIGALTNNNTIANTPIVDLKKNPTRPVSAQMRLSGLAAPS